MGKEIRAKYFRGKIELLENVDLEEGEEIFITVRKAASPEVARDAFKRAAGAWKGTLDFDAYLKDLYDSRRRQTSETGL